MAGITGFVDCIFRGIYSREQRDEWLLVAEYLIEAVWRFGRDAAFLCIFCGRRMVIAIGI